jgi:hypothetical protein
VISQVRELLWADKIVLSDGALEVWNGPVTAMSPHLSDRALAVCHRLSERNGVRFRRRSETDSIIFERSHGRVPSQSAARQTLTDDRSRVISAPFIAGGRPPRRALEFINGHYAATERAPRANQPRLKDL